jgi:hypothetical protein
VFSVPVIAIVLSLLCGAGIVLTAIALRPKRVGETPHCPKCGYNLTGLITEVKLVRCPECGVTSRMANLRRGERHVSRRMLGAGLILILIGGAPMISGGVAVVRGVDIYQYLPARVLAACLGWGDAKIVKASVAELQGRLATGGLSAEALDALIEACLEEQERTEARKDISSKIIDWLGLPSVANAMTAEQKERMYANLCRDFRLEARRVVECGEDIPFALISRRLIPVGYDVEWQVKARCNGEEWPCKGFWPLSPRGGINDFPISSTPGPGPLYVHLDAFVRVAGPRTAPVLYRRELERTLPVEVLPREAPSPIKLVRSAEIDAAVARLVWAKNIIVGKNSGSVQILYMGVYMGVDNNIPCNLAFDVYSKWGNQCNLIGIAYFKSTEGGHTWYVGKNIDEIPDDHVDLILRSSRAAAGRSLDIYEIWEGDLLIENVPVYEATGASWTPTEGKPIRGRLLDRTSAPAAEGVAP